MKKIHWAKMNEFKPSRRKNSMESASHHLKHFWLPSEDEGAKHSPTVAKQSRHRTKNPAQIRATVAISRRFHTCLITFDRIEFRSWHVVKLNSARHWNEWWDGGRRLRPKVCGQSKTTNVWPLVLDFFIFCQVRPNALRLPSKEGQILSTYL